MEATSQETEVGIAQLPIHYDVSEHYVKHQEFIAAIKSVEAALKDFNKQIFGGTVRYEIIILAPQKGSLLQRVGIRVIIAGSVAIGAVAPEFFSGLVKGISGKSIGEHGEEVGKLLLQYYEEPLTPVTAGAAAQTLATATQYFLQAEESNLLLAGVAKREFASSYSARNSFYEACYANREIKAIGFDDEEEFPIKRNDFPSYIVSIPQETAPKKSDEWIVEIKHVTVTSPNWERGEKRLWKGKYAKKKEVLFEIEDDAFWHRVNHEQLVVKIKDMIKVQWAFHLEKSKRKDCKVLKVLEYNQQKLSEPLTDEQLDEILSQYSNSAIPDSQSDLFD